MGWGAESEYGGWSGSRVAELASDDDWFRNDDSQTIMRQKGVKHCIFHQVLED